MTQLAQNKASRSFLIEFFRAFFRSNIHFRTPVFRNPFARANRTQSPRRVIRTGAPIRPYATESKSLIRIEANKILIGTQNASREKLTCTKQTTSHFLIGTKNGFFAHTAKSSARSCRIGRGLRGGGARRRLRREERLCRGRDGAVCGRRGQGRGKVRLCCPCKNREATSGG
jgi:hypothetical protein